MPLSFRRSYKKHPTTDLDRNKRRLGQESQQEDGD